MKWYEKASCKGVDSQVFFPEVLGDQQEGRIWDKARAYCKQCPVIVDCLKFVIPFEHGSGKRNGMWGGMTPKERERFVEVQISKKP